MRNELALLFSALIGLSACSSSPLPPGGGGGADSGSPPGSDGGNPGCARFFDTVRIVVQRFSQDATRCDDPNKRTDDDFDFTAAVTNVAASLITLDSCPPNADCIPFVEKITVEAPYFTPQNYVPKGAFVRVRAHFHRPWGCSAAVEIRSVSSWGGVPNPAGPGGVLYLAAGDGTTFTESDAPFAIKPIALGCANGEVGCGGLPPDDYLLRFEPAGGGASLDVKMASLRNLTDANGRRYDIRNLRSFQTGFCDDYWNWAWLAGAIK